MIQPEFILRSEEPQVFFRRWTIKSAIGNNGNYDWNSRNINEYVTKITNYKNSKGETAEWAIKDEDNGKILSSHKTKGQAVSHLRDMKGHSN